MTLLHLFHAVAVGGLLSGAALALDAALRGAGRPGRGVWVVALALTATAPLWGPRLSAVPGPESPPSVVGAATSATPVTVASPGVLARWTGAASRPVPALPWIWLVAGAAAVTVMAGGFLRLERRVARWPRAVVDGEEVSLSGDFGPALVGLRRPRTVLPRWVLGLARREIDLILAHERAHRRAGDGRLLAAGLLMAAACPWNPWLWLQFRRLRDAVEVDCDRRLLAAGVSRPAYARVLVRVRLRAAAAGWATAALVESSSSLERRLKTMRGFPWTRRRLAVSGLVALGLVVLACETPAPSPVEVETTVVEQEVPVPAGILKLRAGTEGADPLLVVDGVLVSGRSLGDLDRLVAPDDIVRIEVVKGAAARQVYGERGANGVIHITTKSREAEGPLRRDGGGS